MLDVIGVTSFHYDIAPQLDVHGNLARTLLYGEIPGVLLQRDFFVFLTTSIALIVALPALAPIAASLVTLVAAIPPFYVAYTSPLMVPIVPLEYALLTTLMMFSVNVLCSYFVETHAKQQIIDAFSQYVPPEPVPETSRHPETFSMDGEMSVVVLRHRAFLDHRRATGGPRACRHAQSLPHRNDRRPPPPRGYDQQVQWRRHHGVLGRAHPAAGLRGTRGVRRTRHAAGHGSRARL